MDSSILPSSLRMRSRSASILFLNCSISAFEYLCFCFVVLFFVTVLALVFDFVFALVFYAFFIQSLTSVSFKVRAVLKCQSFSPFSSFSASVSLQMWSP